MLECASDEIANRTSWGAVVGRSARPTSRPTVRPERLPIEPPDTNAPPEPKGMPARSARNASAWFSATTTPADSSQLVPLSPEQATTMSKSSEFFVGALGMKARKFGASIETTAWASSFLKNARISSGSCPSGLISPSRSASGTFVRLP